MEKPLNSLTVKDDPDRTYSDRAEGVLDWDAALPDMPARSSGKMRVRLIFGGRSKPINIELSPE